MKSLLSLAIVFATGTAFAGDLSINMAGSTSYLINASAQSCASVVDRVKDPSAPAYMPVNPYYMNFQGLTLEWSNPWDTALISHMDIDFPSLGYRCTIAGNELQALFFDFTNRVDWDGTLSPSSTKSTGSLCRIRCGSVPVPDPKSTFDTTGTITVYGIQKSKYNPESTIKASAPLRLIYQ